ncbi:hypothetical protein D3C87_1422810 [compost metagenome]
MQNKDLNQVLSSQTKRSEEATGTLSKLFRQILAEQRFNMNLWNRNMLRYLKDPRNRIPQNSRDMSSARGNLSKELLRPTMTWGVFEKAIRFLNPYKVRLRLEFEWRGGVKTEYTAIIHVSDKETPEDEDTKIPVHHTGVTVENLVKALEAIDPGIHKK